MKRSERRALPVRRPDRLWGIGRGGYALLAVAAVLLTVLLTGYDARFALMRLIADTLGGDAVLAFTSQFLSPHSIDFLWLGQDMAFSPPGPRFGLVPMGIVWVVLRLQPRRARLWRYAAVGVLGVAVPILEMSMIVIGRWLGIPMGHVLGGWESDVVASQGVLALVSWVVLVAAFPRPRLWPAIAMAGVFAAGWLFQFDVMQRYRGGRGIDSRITDVIYWGWIPMWIVLLVPWAVIQRRRMVPEGHCPGCGYNLAGLAGTGCPECGGAGGGEAAGGR